jgi:EAL domain-containing protein (putative c-di-GMP-specific phosphodiesterase class I)
MTHDDMATPSATASPHPMHSQDFFSKEDILEGIDRKQFEVYYQPIIDNERGTVLAGEALVRWNHPKHGLLHPVSFIDIAERTHAIIELGEYVLREACAQSKKWKDEGRSFYKIATNLSLVQLSDKQFIKKVFYILKQTGVEPEDIEIEVTESTAMHDPEVTRMTLLQLKGIGIRVALDDFGTGYSSLSHLGHLPIHGVKVDKQFVWQAIKNERDKSLLHAIILFARSLDLHVVAEGVETEEQLSLLKSMGCYCIQGFYYTHPLPAAEFEEWCTLYVLHPSMQH